MLMYTKSPAHKEKPLFEPLVLNHTFVIAILNHEHTMHWYPKQQQTSLLFFIVVHYVVCSF